MFAQKEEEKSQKKKAIYSEDFQAMLERLEEEDNEDTSKHQLMKKTRLCIEKVKALEKHFEEENKLQPVRKLKIAEEVGLEPRQVAIWFQNRRARWRTKQLEREYDDLRSSYDALKHDYGSLEQEKLALLAQLKDLKAKIEARSSKMMTTTDISMSSTVNSSKNNVVTNESISTYMNVPWSLSSSTPSSCRTTSSDQFDIASSSMSMDGIQLCMAYPDHILKMEGMDNVHNNNNNNNNNVNDIPCNFFTVDQAPTLHYWYDSDQFN